jgi:ABC-type transporter lipoprotein component MlaA
MWCGGMYDFEYKSVFFDFTSIPMTDITMKLTFFSAKAYNLTPNSVLHNSNKLYTYTRNTHITNLNIWTNETIITSNNLLLPLFSS